MKLADIGRLIPLRVVGDSMEPEFPGGRKLVFDAGAAYPRPLNSAYKTMELPQDGQLWGWLSLKTSHTDKGG